MKKWSLFLLLVASFSWAGAQDLRTELKVEEGLLVNPKQLPEVKKADGMPVEQPAEVLEQDSATLETKKRVEKTANEIPEMEALREKSVYHAVMNSDVLTVSNVNDGRLANDLQQVSAVYRKAGEQGSNCVQIGLAVRQRVKRDPDSVLVVVDEELRANPGCSCEIVKAAVLATDMQVATVVAVVKVAFEASPENARLSAQCAIAACPEALTAIQELASKYEAKSATGESAKSAKSAKGEEATIFSGDEVAATPNPLDLPGGPKGYQITFKQPPLLIITPENTTRVDP